MLLQEENPPPTEKEAYIARILSGTQRLSRLTENLLLISKLENQEIVLDKTRYALDEQLRNDVLALEGIWSKKVLSWNIELKNVSFYGNKGMLSLVWTNLLSNAIRFTPEGSIINVKLTLDDTQAVVSIADTDIGMSAETLAHIFEKFYCGDLSRHTDGNGLGLPLAKRIVSLCGGTIAAESAEQRGTTFTVTLPHEG